MKKLVILLILLAAAVFTAGCTEESQENLTDTQPIQEADGVVESTEAGQNATPQEEGNVTNSTEPGQNITLQEEGTVIEVTDLAQLNASLQQGPVLMKIGSERCGPCKAMKPMLNELATEYKGKARVISIDIDKSPQLATYFGIGYIPDSTIVLNVKGEEYVYMKQDGNITTDRFQARILGTTEKSVLQDVLNLALLQSEKDKSE